MCADRRQKIGLDSIRDSHRARVKRHGFDRRKPPLLENILRELDVIDAEQFEKAKRHALSTGIDICSALVDLEYIREDRLALWLSIKAGLPFITSLKEHATEDAAELIPEKFARRFVIVPLFKRGGAVTAAVANPYDIPALDMILKVTGYSVIPVVSVRSEIFEMIDRIYSGDNAIFEKETGENEEADIVEKEASADSTEEAVVEDKESADESGLGADPEPEDEESGPDKIEIERYGQGKKDKSYDKDIIAEINKIFEKAVKHGASDIHFDPGDSCVYLRFRVDGMLKDIKELPKSIEKSLVARIKLMAALDITETRRPQDGRIKIKADKRSVDIRVSTIPAISGEKIVLRILDKKKGLLSLDKLVTNPSTRKIIQTAIKSPHGIFLLTGPTGSGKTTTLYAALIKLNTPERNIMTIEDPVEYQIERINQIQVNTRVGITFASGLRTFLRQDPNVILVGEIRDKETAEIAVQAALTGHLVLSTLHTNDVPGTITRLLDIGIEPYMISATLICVVSQRLVRVLCPYCKQKYKPSGNLLRQLGVENTGDIVFYSPGGCKKCLNTGYAGREAIYEIFTISQAAKVLISTRPSLEKLRETFVSGGMKTLFENGLEKLKNGVTSIEEIMRVARFGGDNGGL